MDITRRCDYACRILRAAYQSGEAYVSVSDIAEDEDIPYAFARSIQHDLVKGGLIKTVRGARGGLVLNCDPAEVTLLEVLEAVQGPVSVSLCAIDPDYCAEAGRQCAYNKRVAGCRYACSTTTSPPSRSGTCSSREPRIPWWRRPWEGGRGAFDRPTAPLRPADASGVRTSACACAARPSCTQGPCR